MCRTEKECGAGFTAAFGWISLFFFCFSSKPIQFILNDTMTMNNLPWLQRCQSIRNRRTFCSFVKTRSTDRKAAKYCRRVTTGITPEASTSKSPIPLLIKNQESAARVQSHGPGHVLVPGGDVALNLHLSGLRSLRRKYEKELARLGLAFSSFSSDLWSRASPGNPEEFISSNRLTQDPSDHTVSKVTSAIDDGDESEPSFPVRKECDACIRLNVEMMRKIINFFFIQPPGISPLVVSTAVLTVWRR
jgi:hypothetical protein